MSDEVSIKWPPIDVPPPFDNEWKGLVDLTKVAKAPVAKAVGDCTTPDNFCSWTCTKCLKPGDIATCPTIKDTIKVKVTFFVVGSRVISNPDILKRAVDSGHQIGVHTWSHTPLTTQTNEQIIAEIKWTERAIQETAKVTPNVLRPPQGDFDDRVRDIAKQLGYTIVLWEFDSFDWMVVQDPTYPVDYITNNFTAWADDATAKAGHISLEHDLYQQTVDLAPKIFPIVTGKDFNVKTIGGCINKPIHNPLQNAAPAPAPAAPTKRKRQF
ncbi:4591_t:CDS:2 [Entrophospora sp. SA101]|nr:4591_t:CDS:2 [Entrophospora sp. SA101]